MTLVTNVNNQIANTDCAICLNPLVSPKTTPCNHTFCTQCLDQWVMTKATCPLCRKPLKPAVCPWVHPNIRLTKKEAIIAILCSIVIIGLVAVAIALGGMTGGILILPIVIIALLLGVWVWQKHSSRRG